ncbi:MAG: M3 family oligoendopeptidase [Phycisphaerae bacterium]|nr:M3 family oligoendopeptidase [Phycisphaerae bacterium]
MPAPTTGFVPPALDGTRWEQIEPLLQALLSRPVGSASDLERWLVDRGELEAACSEAQANLFIAMTCHTEDQGKQSAFTRYIETIPPRLKPAAFELDRRQVELCARFPLDPGRYGVLERGTRAEVELFRAENVPIQTELAKLGQRFDQVAGAMTVTFDGREQTLPQMARYQEVTDRSVREGAWRAVVERRGVDRETIDGVFDRMIALRHEMSRNAGFDSFVGYSFKAMHRFDYTPRECFDFHDAIERVVVPFMRRLEARRASTLKVDALRPWDLSVDVKGRPPLRPFEGGRQLMSKSVATFRRLDPRLARMLSRLGDGSASRGAEGGACLDLDSRKGKAPGGYQYMRDFSRKPFIFMNAAGLQRDVVTLLHEAGHAFHSMLCENEPLLAYRGSPIEFAEVASMSMELLTMPHWDGADGFYAGEEGLARARRQQLERSVTLFPWIATIDAFQHWLYANPAHTRAERTAFWLDLDRRFGSSCSWEGLERYRDSAWQRQGHLFNNPFYYIEYGIAQLGALQLWLMSLERGGKPAVEAYIKGLSLGGSKPLPELFAAAGLRFDFGPDMVARIVERVEREMERLPE